MQSISSTATGTPEIWGQITFFCTAAERASWGLWIGVGLVGSCLDLLGWGSAFLLGVDVRGAVCFTMSASFSLQGKVEYLVKWKGWPPK